MLELQTNRTNCLYTNDPSQFKKGFPGAAVFLTTGIFTEHGYSVSTTFSSNNLTFFHSLIDACPYVTF